jgi:hypothetical protein
VRASAEWRLVGGRSSTLQLRRGVRRGARRRARIVPGDLTSLLAGLPPGRSNSPAWLPPSMKAAVWYLSSSPRSPRPLSGRTRPGVACRGCGPGRHPAWEPHTRAGGWDLDICLPPVDPPSVRRQLNGGGRLAILSQSMEMVRLAPDPLPARLRTTLHDGGRAQRIPAHAASPIGNSASCFVEGWMTRLRPTCLPSPARAVVGSRPWEHPCPFRV